MKLFFCFIFSIFFHGIWIVFFVFDNNKKTYIENTVVDVEVIDDKTFFDLAHNSPIFIKKNPTTVAIENNIKKSFKLISNKNFKNKTKNFTKISLIDFHVETKNRFLFKRPNYFEMERKNFVQKKVPLIDNLDKVNEKNFRNIYELIENSENNKKLEKKINNIPNLDLKISEISHKIYSPENNFEKNALKKDKYVFIWGEMIKEKILRNLNYPIIAKKNNLDGVVFLRLKVAKSGNLISLDIFKSSGSEILDKAAKKAATDANKFPVAPKEIKGNNFVFRLPVRFQI